MKTRSFVSGWSVSYTVAFAVLLAGVGQVQADYLYNFESLTLGNLITPAQDGWVKYIPSWADAQVVTGTKGNTSKVAGDTGSMSSSGAYRLMGGLSFTSADTAAEQHVWVQGGNATAGINQSGAQPYYMLFGTSSTVEYIGGVPQTPVTTPNLGSSGSRCRTRETRPSGR
jgi:hypothetical protein